MIPSLQAGVQLSAPAKEYFIAHRIGNSPYVNYAATDTYITQIAQLFNMSISNSDPEYRRITDGIYASVRQVSREKKQEDLMRKHQQERKKKKK